MASTIINNPFYLKAFTFNLGDLVKNNQIENLENDLINLFFDEDKEKNDNTIFVISTQEDKSISYLNNIISKIFENFKIKHFSTGPLVSNFNIHTFLIYSQIISFSIDENHITRINIRHRKFATYNNRNNNLNNNNDNKNSINSGYDSPINLSTPKIAKTPKKSLFSTFRKTIKNVKNAVGNTKNTMMIIVPISKRIGRDTVSSHLIIMNSHLPMNNKEAGLGLEARINALKEIKNTMATESIIQDGNFQAIWMGDLNFRLGQIGHINSNQYRGLNNSMKQIVSNDPFKNMVEIGNFKPTCKTLTKKNNEKLNKKECGFNQILNEKTSCYKTMTKKGERIPSYCDRILISKGNNSKLEMRPISLRPVVEYDFVNYSDHNPLMGDFELQFKI